MYYREMRQSDASGGARGIHSLRCLQRNKANGKTQTEDFLPMWETSARIKKVDRHEKRRTTSKPQSYSRVHTRGNWKYFA